VSKLIPAGTVMARSLLYKRAAAAVFLVVLAAALAGAWLAPRVSPAVAAWVTAQPVSGAELGLGGALEAVAAAGDDDAAPAAGADDGRAAAEAAGSTAVAPPAAAPVTTVEAGTRFTMAGLLCAAPPETDEVTVWLRAGDGETWGAWSMQELELNGDGELAGRQAYTDPVWTGDASVVQVAATSAGGRRVVLQAPRLLVVDTEPRPAPTAAVAGVLRRATAVVAGIDLTPPAAAMTTQPDIVTRAEWGANESLRSGSPVFAPVKMAFVHHSASGNGYSRSEAAGIVRGIYYYHTKGLHWSDIGYNFLVDRYGRIYEGRYGGMTKGPIGAQTLGFNTSSTGISVIGNFTSVAPPSAAVTSLKKLVAWKLDVHHVKPSGTATLTCATGQKYATGQRVTFPAIAGHRNANYTSCPGDRLYALLPSIRTAATAMGLPKIWSVSAAEDAISPNGDGVQDKVTLGFTLSAAADWRVEVLDAQGAAVRSFSGSGEAAEVTWAGRSDAGDAVPDGSYRLVASASTSGGEARPATVTVRVDTRPPELTSAEMSPDVFSPNGDGHAETTALRYVPAQRGAARVSLLDGGVLVKRLTGWRAVEPRTFSVSWAGGGDGAPAGEGRYQLQLELRDVAGNGASFARTVRLDTTLGFPRPTPSTISPNGDGVRDDASLGFVLTRPATVEVLVTKAGATVRRLSGGQLGAGERAVAWDGADAAGTAVTSGSYRFTVTAVSSLGTVSVTEPLMVDRYRPRLSAPDTSSVTLGKTARLAYTVRDPYSRTVKVWAVVRTLSGREVTTLSAGWVGQGVARTLSWKPPARRTYRVTFQAVDRGGNRQAAGATTTLRVR
jgi:flagellar hook assembly protein FlgD